MVTVARERSSLVPLQVMPTSKPTPLTNAAIEILLVITVDVVSPMSTILVIVLNRFIFFTSLSRASI